jgi:outer membrane receptor protein involved in Fe transport
MLRSSLQRAIRAPDIFERFQPTTPGIASLVDPCSASSPNRTAQMLALCRTQAAALGFTASFADTFAPPFPDTRIINSGTRNLEAETADTLTIGAVWRPSGGDRLLEPSLSVDWYKISIDNAITYADPQSVVSGCYGAGGVNAALDPANPACRTFIRSAVDFALSDVASPRVNQALVETSGVDISGSLRADIGSLSGQGWLGELRTRALASRLEYFTEQNSPQQPRIDYAGTIGGGTSPYKSLPEWRGQFDLEWLTGPWMVGLSARHIGAMQHRLKRVDATSMATGVGAATYWDLTASLEIESLATVRFGALNLLDRQPELFTPGTDANTDPSVYDVIGRRFWVSITLRS